MGIISPVLLIIRVFFFSNASLPEKFAGSNKIVVIFYFERIKK